MLSNVTVKRGKEIQSAGTKTNDEFAHRLNGGQPPGFPRLFHSSPLPDRGMHGYNYSSYGIYLCHANVTANIYETSGFRESSAEEVAVCLHFPPAKCIC